MDDTSTTEDRRDSEEMILVSAGRSDDEKREAYTVEWLESVDDPSLADQIRTLF